MLQQQAAAADTLHILSQPGFHGAPAPAPLPGVQQRLRQPALPAAATPAAAARHAVSAQGPGRPRPPLTLDGSECDTWSKAAKTASRGTPAATPAAAVRHAASHPRRQLTLNSRGEATQGNERWCSMQGLRTTHRRSPTAARLQDCRDMAALAHLGRLLWLPDARRPSPVVH